MDPARCESMILNSFDAQFFPRENNDTVVCEMDFFAGNTNWAKHEQIINVDVIKKEREFHDGVCNTHDHQLQLNLNTSLNLLSTNTTGSDKSTIDDGRSPPETNKRTANELAVLQAELERMNRENERLKSMLSQVKDEYHLLQRHINSLGYHQENKMAHGENNIKMKAAKELRLKRLGQEVILEEDNRNVCTETDSSFSTEIQRMIDSIENNSLSNGEWNPKRDANSHCPKDLDHQGVEATMKKARVSVRARSEASMISDGCQWRKYGQKMAKGNPCPRAYYRCTMATGCPVRKQVQRCAEDQSILITTYEGSHNHPLPTAAMSMASTTSAAASMLLSGSISSSDHLIGLYNHNAATLTRTTLPFSANLTTISASAPFPTITLDLTATPNNSSAAVSHRKPSLGPLQIPDGNDQNFTMSAKQVLGLAIDHNDQYNTKKFPGTQNSGDIMSAATAAITANPNFPAALAAAISSIIGNGNQDDGARNHSEGNLGKSSLFGS